MVTCDGCGEEYDDTFNSECPVCGIIAFDGMTGIIGLWG